MTRTLTALAAFATAAALPVLGVETATFQVRQLTPETALKAAQAALAHCRKDGFQVSVALVDRSGLVQVVLRDRFAGAHSPETATNKAWTAVSFRTNTMDLQKITQPDQSNSGIRQLPRVVAVGGGLKIEAGGSIIGGIGVSGAPGGDLDHVCAVAGFKAIADSLEF